MLAPDPPAIACRVCRNLTGFRRAPVRATQSITGCLRRVRALHAEVPILGIGRGRGVEWVCGC